MSTEISNDMEFDFGAPASTNTTAQNKDVVEPPAVSDAVSESTVKISSKPLELNESMQRAVEFDINSLKNNDPRLNFAKEAQPDSSAQGQAPQSAPVENSSSDANAEKEEENDLDPSLVSPLSGMPGVRMMGKADPTILKGKDALMYMALSPFIYGAKKIDENRVKKWQGMDARRSVDEAVAVSEKLTRVMADYKENEFRKISQFIEKTEMTPQEFNHAMKHDSKFQEAYKEKILKQFSDVDPMISNELDRRRADLAKSWENADRAARATGADISELREENMKKVLEASKNLATGVNPDGTLKMEEEKTKEMMEKLQEAIKKVVQTILRVLRIS